MGHEPVRREQGTFHEPTHPQPLLGGEQKSGRATAVGVRGGFMAPMRGQKTVESSHASRQTAPRRVLFALLVGSAALCADAVFIPACAAEAPRTNEAGGRYLFIVDTSFSMHRRAANAGKVVGDLLLSGLNGQLRPGDTIGVWTFNEKLNAGNFPLQRWMPQARQRIAVGVVQFLQRQRYEKPTQIDKALAPMMRVVKDSDKITVLLISDGDHKVSGTPFDTEINEAFKLNSSAQRKSNMPFVTVLRARKGEFIGCRVSMPPWPVDFPEFPAEPPVAQAPISPEKPKPAAPKAERPPPTTPSLIVIGKNPEPSSSTSTNATPTEAAKAQTTATPAPTLPTAIPKAKQTQAATTAPETNSIAKSPEPPVSSPTAPAESLPAAIRATKQQVTLVPSASAKSETAPPPKTEPTSQPAPVTVTIPDKPKLQAAPETSPKPAAAIAATSVATTVPPATPSPIAPTPAESARATSSPVAEAKSEPASSAQAQTPVVQTAVATPSETVFEFAGILIAGVALLVVVLGLAYALKRRSRTTLQASLITRSMDRDKK